MGGVQWVAVGWPRHAPWLAAGASKECARKARNPVPARVWGARRWLIPVCPLDGTSIGGEGWWVRGLPN